MNTKALWLALTSPLLLAPIAIPQSMLEAGEAERIAGIGVDDCMAGWVGRLAMWQPNLDDRLIVNLAFLRCAPEMDRWNNALENLAETNNVDRETIAGPRMLAIDIEAMSLSASRKAAIKALNTPLPGD